MPGAPTPNLQLTVPTVGGDTNNWGNELNTDLLLIDALGAFNAISVSGNTNINLGTSPEVVVFVTTAAGTISVVLPSAVSHAYHAVTVKKVDSGLGTVAITSLAGQMDGNATWNLINQYQFVRFISDGSNWNVVSKT